MEQFKETLRSRMLALGTFILGLLVLVSYSLFYPTSANSEAMHAFMMGLNAGLMAVVLVVSIRTIVKYLRAMKDPERLRSLYIYENDERRRLIQSKVGGTAIQLILMALATATVVSEFFNQTVFFTLLAVLLFSAAVKAGLLFYYERKLG